jgi:hypothetical protein
MDHSIIESLGLYQMTHDAKSIKYFSYLHMRKIQGE